MLGRLPSVHYNMTAGVWRNLHHPFLLNKYNIILMKKIILTIVVLLIGLYLVNILVLKPVMKPMGECFTIEADYMESTFVEAALMKDIDEAERRDYICSTDEISFNRLIACVQEAKTKSFLGDWIVNDFPLEMLNARKKLEESVTIHNRICSENPFFVEKI